MTAELISTYGPDSFIGRLASTMQGSTDTTLYILTIYFGSVQIKKMGYALKVGLFADLVGIIASIVIVTRSEEHTSELQSRGHLVCRLLLEKKKTHVKR